VQGTLDGRPFLVSCPINRYSSVTVRATQTGLIEGPPERSKALAAACATLSYLGCPTQGLSLAISSNLPIGRGFGSSTADVVGAIAAVARLFGLDLWPEEIARLAVAIEPSDSTMFPGLALLDHRGASRWRLIGQPVPATLLVLELAGAVDTVGFNAQLDLERWWGLAPQHAWALDTLMAGLVERDLAKIGAASTASTRAQQELLPKAELAAALDLLTRLDGLGICAAHSGTALGLLLAKPPADLAGLLGFTRTALPTLERAWLARIVPGGVRPGGSASTSLFYGGAE
jgi:L-threonine kinase